jgi:hypothetical protein
MSKVNIRLWDVSAVRRAAACAGCASAVLAVALAVVPSAEPRVDAHGGGGTVVSVPVHVLPATSTQAPPPSSPPIPFAAPVIRAPQVGQS